jgi:hypothetical protein
MKDTQRELLSELTSQLGDDEKETCQSLAACLTELGYVPQRLKVQRFVLAFKSSEVGQTIAKIGVRNKKVFYGIKFYACKNPPEKFMNAVRNAAVRSNGQYVCCGCEICGAAPEDRGYRVVLPDGEEFLRCGAYVVEIPELTAEDADSFCRLLREQHAYFTARKAPR